MNHDGFLFSCLHVRLENLLRFPFNVYQEREAMEARLIEVAEHKTEMEQTKQSLANALRLAAEKSLLALSLWLLLGCCCCGFCFCCCYCCRGCCCCFRDLFSCFSIYLQ